MEIIYLGCLLPVHLVATYPILFTGRIAPMYLRGLAPDGSLPSHTCHQVCWCALTAPFHPRTVTDAICSLLHYAVGFHRLTVSQHHYPMECGLSSAEINSYRDFLAYPATIILFTHPFSQCTLSSKCKKVCFNYLWVGQSHSRQRLRETHCDTRMTSMI